MIVLISDFLTVRLSAAAMWMKIRLQASFAVFADISEIPDFL
jgi:hypothetical protein